ncbi:MAG: carotenoid 1,2-hydratase [Chthoniobacterales bacterium]|nr:carotenoid 1,2-hydratase [Chthoniobacterales bacterium]
MKRLVFLLTVTVLLRAAVGAEWKTSEPGWRYEFPRDHAIHPDFKTEWWYFTGNLTGSRGERYGYQLTFFRHGIRPRSQGDAELSRFVLRDLKFAHFTVTDAAGERFHFQQNTSRGAFGEAGFNEGERLAWIDDWTLQLTSGGAFHLKASSEAAAIDLHLVSAKPPVIHGENGVSKKAVGEGHASHYYSLTRLTTTGEVRVGDKALQVQGDSWFDHEWATNQLAEGQIGWDWLSVHFDDGAELMLYQLRLSDGRADPTSSGTWVAPDGSSVHLPSSAFRMTPTAFWKSDRTPARYPIGWEIEVPGRGLRFTVRAAVEKQELALLPLAYWEGAVDVTGSRDGKAVVGRGYLELTGYAGPLRELSR